MRAPRVGAYFNHHVVKDDHFEDRHVTVASPTVTVKRRIALCLPSDDVVKTNFAISMWNLLQNNPHDLTVINARSSLIPHSRYELVREALARRCGFVLFCDTDLSFPDDALLRLLAHGKDVVGATYLRRRPPYGILGVGMEDVEPGATGVRLMERMPIGFCLIRADVFRRTPKPWFPVTWDPETELITAEDYGFCRLAREAGYDLWCDLDLSRQLGHEGSQVLTWGQED